MAGRQTRIQLGHGPFDHGFFRVVRPVFGYADDHSARDQFVAMADFFLHLHDDPGIYWSLANLPMLPFFELESMDQQTVIAILVVALCAIVVLRSWFFFWLGLIRKPDPNKSSQSSCSGCVNGCQKANNGPRIVELKREGPL